MSSKCYLYHTKLTSAVQSIPIQLGTSVTAAVEAANGVIADLFTSSIAGGTLINI